jgi:hypothetical protein
VAANAGGELSVSRPYDLHDVPPGLAGVVGQLVQQGRLADTAGPVDVQDGERVAVAGQRGSEQGPLRPAADERAAPRRGQPVRERSDDRRAVPARARAAALPCDRALAPAAATARSDHRCLPSAAQPRFALALRRGQQRCFRFT